MLTMTKRICPFCGSALHTTIEVDLGQWSVVCDLCNATGPMAWSQASATEKWNGSLLHFSSTPQSISATDPLSSLYNTPSPK